MKIFKKILNFVFSFEDANIYMIDIYDLSKNNYQRTNLEYRLATIDEVENFDEEGGQYNKKAKIYVKDRLKKGDLCAIALDKGKIVGYSWIMKNKMELSQNRLIDISRNIVYRYKTFVNKEYRGMRIIDQFDCFFSKEIAKEKYQYMVSVINKDNNAANKARSRAGYEIIGTIRTYTLGTIKLNIMSAEAKEKLTKG